LRKCRDLVFMEKELGFRSSFYFVPERCDVPGGLLHYIRNQGFEVGVHGLKHDGKLYNSWEMFSERASRINDYLREWDAVGFRSPSMHHNLEWLHELEIEYDASTFDTDPFEPQADGVRTIFPFFVHGDSRQKGYVELPYTLPQDFTLFVLMKEKGIDIWRRKLDWIASRGGMALVNTHPDYMSFEAGQLERDEYPADLYMEFLEYVRANYGDSFWHVLPREMAGFWAEEVSRKKYREGSETRSNQAFVAGS